MTMNRPNVQLGIFVWWFGWSVIRAWCRWGRVGSLYLAAPPLKAKGLSSTCGFVSACPSFLKVGRRNDRLIKWFGGKKRIDDSGTPLQN